MSGPKSDEGVLLLYHSQDHDCPYLPERTAHNLFVDPQAPKSPQLYGHLIDRGFRRSGEHLYRPHCAGCRACLSTRLPVSRFSPRRSHRRNCRQNVLQIQMVVRRAEPEAAHYALYRRYVDQRHPRGEMAGSSFEEFSRFLICDWCETLFLEFYLEERLVATAVTDLLPQGLSALYTFYDPGLSYLGLGTYAILQQIHHSQELGLPFLYLGYWVPGCRKMEYKSEFRPLQLYLNEHWSEFALGEAITLPEIATS